jgi:ribosome-binding factor A
MKVQSSKFKSHRREQLASSLQRALGELIAEGLADPRIRGLISVTGVDLSPDNQYADVRISVLPESGQALTVQGLQSAAGHLRAEIGRKLRIRNMPRLRFEADASLKKQAQVLNAIRKAVGDEAPAPPSDSGEEARP